MSEAVSSNVESVNLSVSEGTRIVLRKNFDLPVSVVVEEVQKLVGKAPSKVLVYQLKNKMKKASESSSKEKKKLKKMVNKNHSFHEKIVNQNSKKTERFSKNQYVEVAAKLAKIRGFIKEFGSKEELIGWVNLA
jgi:hypothetical protein